MLPLIEKLHQLAATNKIDACLLTSPASLKYIAGYFYNFEIGPSPFHLIPAAFFSVTGGNCNLIIADDETDKICDNFPASSITKYESYTYKKPLKFRESFLERLDIVLKETKGKIKRLGVEIDSIPGIIIQSFLSSFPDVKIVDITTKITELRMVKDQDELNSIRAAVHLCDIGQKSVLEFARPGISELELFNKVREAIEKEAGLRIPIMADLVSGDRTSNAGGPPTSRIIQQGDLVLSDLTPCLNGYWGDTCNTISIGKPSNKRKDHFLQIKNALHEAISLIKPGIRAIDIDRLLRGKLSVAGNSYEHHSGHGIGVVYHEEPRITPYNKIMLKQDMVIALEPAIYTKKYGIRLEHVVRVTETGSEILSDFDHIISVSG